MVSPGSIRGRTAVFIVASVRLYREGLAAALGRAGDIDLAGTAAAPAELGDRLDEIAHPVLLLDVATLDGPAALTRLLETHPGARVVMLALSEDPAEILDWIEAGARGYVTRQHSIADLVAAIDGLVRDELTCPPQVAAALMRRVTTLAAGRRQEWAGGLLSPREVEIVALIDRGLSNKQIAAQLFITLATVKNHVHNILDKLGVRGRAEAAAYVHGRRPGRTSVHS